MTCTIMWYPKIELQSFSRSAEPVVVVCFMFVLKEDMLVFDVAGDRDASPAPSGGPGRMLPDNFWKGIYYLLLFTTKYRDFY